MYMYIFQSAEVGKALKEQESRGGLIAAVCAGDFFSILKDEIKTITMAKYIYAGIWKIGSVTLESAETRGYDSI